MQKVIEIEGQKIKFRSSGATPRLYRDKFGSDLFADVSHLQSMVDPKTKEIKEGSNLSSIENLAYIMAKQADDKVPDDVIAWLDKFESLTSIYKKLPELLEVWNDNTKTTVSPKKA